MYSKSVLLNIFMEKHFITVYCGRFGDRFFDEMLFKINGLCLSLVDTQAVFSGISF